ncbi:MAG TPA: hypothetical protein VG738_07610 [Chitinophagaceae bacterium]|nr:hypothetical protein [Chitinophagaceae bacterium]
MVDVIKPPIATVAKGFCDSEPMPVEIAAGSKPIATINAVITTGLILETTPCKMASLIGNIFIAACHVSAFNYCRYLPGFNLVAK